MLVGALVAGCSGASTTEYAAAPDAAQADTSMADDGSSEPDAAPSCEDGRVSTCSCSPVPAGHKTCVGGKWSQCDCTRDAGADTAPIDAGEDAEPDASQDAEADSEADSATPDAGTDTGADTGQDGGGAADAGADAANCTIKRFFIGRILPEAGLVEITGDCSKSNGVPVVGVISPKTYCWHSCNFSYESCGARADPFVIDSVFVCRFLPSDGPTAYLEYYCKICQ